MPPGPKNKAGCPSDLHLKLPEDVRQMIDSLGPGRYQDKLIECVKKCNRKKHPDSLIETQSKILQLSREIRELKSQLDPVIENLKIRFGLSSEEAERILDQIWQEVDGGSN